MQEHPAEEFVGLEVSSSPSRPIARVGAPGWAARCPGAARGSRDTPPRGTTRRFDLDDGRVDRPPRSLADVVDEQPLLHADLGGGEPGALGVVHGLHHVVDQPDERPVDLVDFTGNLLQHRVADRRGPCTRTWLHCTGWRCTSRRRRRRRHHRLDVDRVHLGPVHVLGGSTIRPNRSEGRGRAARSGPWDGRPDPPLAPCPPDTLTPASQRSPRRSTARPGPRRSASAAKGGSPSASRSARSATASSVGSACSGGDQHLVVGSRVCTSSRPAPSRPPTSRAPSPAGRASARPRRNAARAVLIDVENATRSARVTRWRAASVPTTSRASGLVARRAPR